MPAPRDQAMLVQAATLYYLEGKSQSEVAAAIGVSRSNVSRVLAAARENGIVDIRIKDPFGRAEELEAELAARFGLVDARVAPTSEQGDVLSRLGELGAKWLLENLPEHGSVSLSWGSSVQAVVDAVPNSPMHPSLEILPLVGGLSSVDSARDGNVLVHSLATKLGAKHRWLHTPAVVQSKETRDAFVSEPAIGSVLTAAGKAQIAIVGIGVVGLGASSAILDSMHLSASELKQFHESNAVGDCCTRYFDRDGQAVESPASDRVVSIDLPTLRKIPKVVGVAQGVNEVAGVHAALVGKILDVLIVDAALAQALLQFADR